MKVRYQNQKTPGFRAERAQAIVEFAIVLPILMMILVGIFEVGRLLFIYTAVTNSSREAVRFGSALGYDDNGYHKYRDCAGIRDVAKRSAYFMNLQDIDIDINYDHGPGTSSFADCPPGFVGEDPTVIVNDGATQDRVLITVRATYNPLIRLIPIGSRTITSASARTILGYVEIGSSSGGGGGPNTATAVPGTPGTIVPTDTLTATATIPSNTPTNTATSGPIATFTPLPSSTPTLTVTSTKTTTPTLTVTNTPTITPTFTQTTTPTVVPGCSNITTGSISYVNNTMNLTITNQNASVTVSNIQVTWNASNGHQSGSDKTLILQSANLGTTFWSGINNSTGSYTITPASLTIPGNNATSTITFTFHQTYDTPKSTDSIIINLSTPGCSAIHKP